MLQDGRVLIAGGDNGGVPNNSLEIYDPSSGNFSFAGTMSSARTQHAMAVLQEVKDAACGMMIDKATAIAEGHTLTRDGVAYYFCSDSCKRKFSQKPERYIAANPSGPHS